VYELVLIVVINMFCVHMHHTHSVCTPSPVSAGAPVGQRTTSSGNTCADTPNLSFYGHIGGRPSPAALKSGNNVNTFGKVCQKCAMNWWTAGACEPPRVVDRS